jgi:hypothetical protein
MKSLNLQVTTFCEFSHLIMKKVCKANKDDKMDCDDDYNGRLDCKNKRVQKCLWEK